jgi:hypothetical protein
MFIFGGRNIYNFTFNELYTYSLGSTLFPGFALCTLLALRSS